MKKPLSILSCQIAVLSLFSMLVEPVFGYDILMFGDSITQGLQRNSSDYIYGIQSPPNGSRVNGSYGPRLEGLLGEVETSYAYNWGWSGERTVTAVGRIGSVLSSQKADYILILEGANDLLNGVSMSSTKANLGILIDKSIAAGVEPIISEITPLSCPKKCGGESLVNALNDMVIDLASEKGVVLSEILTPFNAGWSLYGSGDGIHVSDQGYVLMATVWYNAIKKTIQIEKGGENIMPFISPILLKK